MHQRPTKRSTLRLSELARHVAVPDGIVSTGWPAVRDRCRSFGIGFDGWQHGIGQIALGKRADGHYAASVGGVVLSIPRQTGKTYLIGWLVFALCSLSPNVTVIWTAHRTRTANETFQKMRAMALRPKVRKWIDGKPRQANGEQEIRFTNGSRILFGAREQGFGRGFDEVDVLIFDEAQILTENAMSDMVPATNAAPNGLVFLMGTPPRPGKDPGEVFAARRADALSGDGDTAYVEFSADEDAKVIDWEQLAQANPSYPERTGKTAILRMQKLLGSDESFRREAYGIWSTHMGLPPEIDAAQFAACESLPDLLDSRAYGVRFSAGGDRMALAVAALTDDDRVFVEVLDSGPTSVGLGGLTQWLSDRWQDADGIVIDGIANAGLLTEALLEARVPARRIKRTGPGDVTTASARLVELVRFGRLAHAGQPGLVDAATRATRREIGKQGGWGFGCSDPDVDVPALEAVALAISGLRDRPSTYDNDDSAPRGARRGRTAVVM